MYYFIVIGAMFILFIILTGSEASEPKYDDARMIRAIIQIESGGNDKAYNAKEEAAGPLQIRPMCLDDVNRIAVENKITEKGEKLFTMRDRWNRALAVRMFFIYTTYYCDYATDGAGKKSPIPKTWENRCKIWNGGPLGYLKPSTDKYWRKVLKEYKKL